MLTYTSDPTCAPNIPREPDGCCEIRNKNAICDMIQDQTCILNNAIINVDLILRTISGDGHEREEKMVKPECLRDAVMQNGGMMNELQVKLEMILKELGI